MPGLHRCCAPHSRGSIAEDGFISLDSSELEAFSKCLTHPWQGVTRYVDNIIRKITKLESAYNTDDNTARRDWIALRVPAPVRHT